MSLKSIVLLVWTVQNRTEGGYQSQTGWLVFKKPICLTASATLRPATIKQKSDAVANLSVELENVLPSFIGNRVGVCTVGYPNTTKDSP